MDADVVARRHHVTVRGSGARTLVFSHGLGADQTLWHGVAERLASEYRLVLFDHVGCGRAERSAYDPVRHGSLDGYATDLADVTACFGGESPVLVAHSIGGAIGLLAVDRFPTLFERMVLLAPSPRFLDDPPDYRGGLRPSDVDDLLAVMDQNFMGWATAFADTVAPGEGARRMFESFCATDPQSLRAFATLALNVDVRPLLSRVQTPALIVQCARDSLVAPAVGEMMHARLAGSSYRFLEVDGHCPHVTHPALVEGAVRDYVSASRS